MTLLKLKFILKSDATFGRGDGVAGLVDSEVQHDEYGLPFLGGRALKGLLEEECANIVFALKVQQNKYLFSWDKIPGNDNVRLIEFLTKKFDIDWINKAEIEKIDGGNTIIVSAGEKNLSLSLNDEKNKVNLKIGDIRTVEFLAKAEKNELNIYKKEDVFNNAAKNLFGCSGSSDSEKSIVHIGDARLPHDLQKAIAHNTGLNREQVLNSLTAIRHQTAIDEKTGASKDKSLRSMRVILRDTPFEADISFIQNPCDMDLPLLAACVKALKKAGTGRNRGRGELVAFLHDDVGNDITDIHFSIFQREVMK